MKQLVTTLCMMAVITTALVSCHNKKETTQATVDEEKLYATYKPYTRWWWHSAYIDTNDVRDQLIWMKEHEFGGVEIAWIYPMFCDSTTSHPDFLSAEWAKPVEFAKRCADSLGLGCDFTFGTMWPFADVDLPDGDQTRNYFDSIEIAARPWVWDHPKVGRIINHLNKGVFERYAAKMNAGLSGAYHGKKSGLFVDSWEVETEYLWTPGFEKTFMEEHGYDIEPYFKEKKLMDAKTHKIYDHDVWYDYMSTLSGYVMREFYQPFADNATKNGCFSRSQCGGAPTDLLTAFTLVDIPETEAILYEPCFSKITASAAEIGGKQAVTAETFTCAYGWTSLRSNNFRGHSPHQGREQVADLKLICDALFANGTNQIIWHGMPFNKVGDTSNYFYTTCQLSSSELCNLSGETVKTFNHYMGEVSKYMRRGHNYSSLAVYMPLEDSWMTGAYPEGVVPKEMNWLWGAYEMRYINTPEQFKGMQPLWVNEHFLQTATYNDGVLTCGKAKFTALYIDVNYMELSAIEAITRLAKAGLPVCMVSDPKEPGKVKHTQEYAAALATLRQQPSVSTETSILNCTPLIEGEQLPDFWIREDQGDYYVFVANPLTQTIKYPLDYCYAFTDKGCTKSMTINHHGRQDHVDLKFRPTESILLEITNKGVKQIDLNYLPKRLREE
ncbi:MAG: hypothetical protein KBT04_05590 [Bacteroidales bacterium]|nr:hypothetical protein [Candidatus Colimorpha onthohippi]